MSVFFFLSVIIIINIIFFIISFLALPPPQKMNPIFEPTAPTGTVKTSPSLLGERKRTHYLITLINVSLTSQHLPCAPTLWRKKTPKGQILGENLTLKWKRFCVWYSAVRRTVLMSSPKSEGEEKRFRVAWNPWRKQQIQPIKPIKSNPNLNLPNTPNPTLSVPKANPAQTRP